MTRITAPCLTLLLAAAALAAPVPKTATDPRDAANAGEWAEPAIDPAKLADDAALRKKDAANRQGSGNNLRQIAQAVHNYGRVHRRMPGYATNKDGEALLSWRVAIL